MRTYKKIGLDPRAVKVIQCNINSKDAGSGHKIIQIVTPITQPKQYAITLTMTDKRTFNRLLKRLGRK